VIYDIPPNLSIGFTDSNDGRRMKARRREAIDEMYPPSAGELAEREGQCTNTMVLTMQPHATMVHGGSWLSGIHSLRALMQWQ